MTGQFVGASSKAYIESGWLLLYCILQWPELAKPLRHVQCENLKIHFVVGEMAEVQY